MTALYILLALAALVAAVLLAPVGLRLRYDREGLAAWVILGPVHLGLGKKKPPKKKPPKPAKEKAPKGKAPKPPKGNHSAKPGGESGDAPPPESGGTLAGLKVYLPTAKAMLGAVRRRLTVRRLTLLVNLAGDDPCDLAVNYGRTWAALGSGLALLEGAFRIRQRRVEVACDFAGEETRIYGELVIVACPARLLAVAIRYGWQLLKIYWNQKKGGADA